MVQKHSGFAFYKEVIFVDQDTTPDVSATNIFQTNNTVVTSITDFDGGVTGQIITIVFIDALTTLVASATLLLAGGVNFTSTANDVMTLLRGGTSWIEVSRSIN